MPNTHQWVDLSYLESISGGDQELIHELISIFLEQIPEFTEEMNTGLVNHDWIKLAAVAHKAKSSVLSMGMEKLGNKGLKNLELLAKEMRARELSQADPTNSELNIEKEKLAKNLKNYPPDQQKWVQIHCNEIEISKLIRKFEKVCNQASEELQSELEK